MAAGVVEEIRDEPMRALGVHVGEIHGRSGWVRGLQLVITVWFPSRRWFLLVIFNLSSTIAFRAVLTVIYPATAITTDCQPLSW